MVSNGKSAVICDVQHPAISAVLLSFYRDALIAFTKIEMEFPRQMQPVQKGVGAAAAGVG